MGMYGYPVLTAMISTQRIRVLTRITAVYHQVTSERSELELAMDLVSLDRFCEVEWRCWSNFMTCYSYNICTLCELSFKCCTYFQGPLDFFIVMFMPTLNMVEKILTYLPLCRMFSLEIEIIHHLQLASKFTRLDLTRTLPMRRSLLLHTCPATLPFIPATPLH